MNTTITALQRNLKTPLSINELHHQALLLLLVLTFPGIQTWKDARPSLHCNGASPIRWDSPLK
jgi:hypothetical protein